MTIPNLDLISKAADFLRKADKIPEYKTILEAMDSLLEQKKIISGLEEENKELKDKIKLKKELVYENNAYWKKNKEDERIDGPFCSRCFDKDKLAIRLHPGHEAFFRCPECEKTVNTGSDKGFSYNRHGEEVY